MRADRHRWNLKFSQRHKSAPEPSPLLQEYYTLTQGHVALDLATGLGRNAQFLASKGFQVMAVDISDLAMTELKALKQQAVQPVQIDLDLFRPKPASFDLVASFKFLDRRLCPYIKETLKPGGVLIFESNLEAPGLQKQQTQDYNHYNDKQKDQPLNRDFLLRSNELLHLFLDLHIVYYAETIALNELSGRQEILARMVALKQ